MRYVTSMPQNKAIAKGLTMVTTDAIIMQQSAYAGSCKHNIKRRTRNTFAITLQGRNQFVRHVPFTPKIELRYQRGMPGVADSIVNVARTSGIFRRHNA